METSILISTKNVLGISEGYTAFDEDIIMHINASFAVLNQLGVGPVEGFAIEDELAVWTDFALAGSLLNLTKTYIYLKVRMLFDPPGTSYLLNAMTEQIDQYEWRLREFSEGG